MFHVIEHVADPSHYVKIIYNLLKKNGLFVLETPNSNSLDARIFKKNYWGGYHIPRHWNIYNDKNIRSLLKKNKFNNIKIKFKTGHYFWLMSFYNFIKTSNLKFLRHIKLFFNPFKRLGLPNLIIFTLFDIIRSFLGYKTSAMLVIAKKN